MVRPHRDRPSEEVHIIVVGWELDRAVLPFTQDLEAAGRMKADRVILVVPNPGGSKGFHGQIQERLEKIAKVSVKAVRRKDAAGKHVEFDDVVSAVSVICHDELTKGNRVHINMSTGSKVSAFAAGLAGMAFITKDAGSLYYVEPERYADNEPCEHWGKKRTTPIPLSSGMADIRVFEPVTLNLPDAMLMDALGFLASKGKKGRVKAIHLLEHLCKGDYPPFENVALERREGGGLVIAKEGQAVRMKLLRNVLDPLSREGFIETHKEGRENRITLTDRGWTYARFSPTPLSEAPPPPASSSQSKRDKPPTRSSRKSR